MTRLEKFKKHILELTREQYSIRMIWQINAIIGFLVISMAMPFALKNDSCVMWLLSPSLAFLWLIFSIDKGSGGKELNCVLDLHKIHSPQPVLVVSSFIAVLLLCSSAGILSEKIIEFLGIETLKEQPLVEALKHSSLLGKIIIGVLVSVLAPLSEEIAFRRLLFRMLLPCGIWFSILFTSLLFAVLHFYLKGVLPLFVLALILQLLYVKTKNLWTSVQVHVLFNLLTFVGALFGKGN